MPRIEVVPRPAVDLALLDGFGRRQVFDTETVRVGETRVGPGVASHWHHHGERTLFGYVLTGQVVLEFGPRGAESVRPTAGDFFRIPAGLVHRDVNPGQSETRIVSIIIGRGPPAVEVSGPEA
jgi:uncharacterized RmlC-like cupin family protein